jgi:hypothetical protein
MTEDTHDPGLEIRPAGFYLNSSDTAVITCFFNPASYHSKERNYYLFEKPFREAGIFLVTMECVFGSGQPRLSAERVHIVRATDIMWQKERLLNLALKHIPSKYSKIVWIDCDIVFVKPDWLPAVSEALTRWPIVQPFRNAVGLPAGVTSYSGEGTVIDGFGYRYGRDPGILSIGTYAAHGHTGFVWGARRDLLEGCQLYDASIIGGGDHLMIHGMCGDADSPCVRRVLGTDTPHHNHFRSWAHDVHQFVKGQIGSIDGTILHLWHGSKANRNYFGRNQELRHFEFDPAKDLKFGADGCWEWTSRNPTLKQWSREYFLKRNEDAQE